MTSTTYSAPGMVSAGNRPGIGHVGKFWLSSRRSDSFCFPVERLFMMHQVNLLKAFPVRRLDAYNRRVRQGKGTPGFQTRRPLTLHKASKGLFAQYAGN